MLTLDVRLAALNLSSVQTIVAYQRAVAIGDKTAAALAVEADACIRLLAENLARDIQQGRNNRPN